MFDTNRPVIDRLLPLRKSTLLDTGGFQPSDTVLVGFGSQLSHISIHFPLILPLFHSWAQSSCSGHTMGHRNPQAMDLCSVRQRCRNCVGWELTPWMASVDMPMFELTEHYANLGMSYKRNIPKSQELLVHNTKTTETESALHNLYGSTVHERDNLPIHWPL